MLLIVVFYSYILFYQLTLYFQLINKSTLDILIFFVKFQKRRYYMKQI